MINKDMMHSVCCKMRVKAIAAMDAIKAASDLCYGADLGPKVAHAYSKILDGTFAYVDELIDEVDETTSPENVRKLVEVEMERLADENLRPLLSLEQYYAELASLITSYNINAGSAPA